MAATMGQSGALCPNLQGAGGAVIMIIMSTQFLHVKSSLTPQFKRVSKSKDNDEDNDIKGYRNDDNNVNDKNDKRSYR